MNTVDIVLGIILLLAFYYGFKKGLLITLASLVGLILGIYGAVYFSDFVGGYLSNWFDWSPETTKWMAFAITFLGIVFLAHFIGKLLTKIADFTALGLLNKLLGGLFSLAQYALIISVIFLFFSASNVTGYMISEEKKANSKLYGPVASLAPMILPALIEEFHKIKETPIEPDETPIETGEPEN